MQHYRANDIEAASTARRRRVAMMSPDVWIGAGTVPGAVAGSLPGRQGRAQRGGAPAGTGSGPLYLG